MALKRSTASWERNLEVGADKEKGPERWGGWRQATEGAGSSRRWGENIKKWGADWWLHKGSLGWVWGFF